MSPEAAVSPEPAADLRRVVILGNAGSGKSTLARRLGGLLSLPVVHLDLLFWQPGWREPEPEAFRDRVRAALTSDRWVCEGNYSRLTFDLRLPRADLVIWLDTPRITCLRRVLRRSARPGARPDLPAGCVERLDRHFLAFLAHVWRFDRATRPGIEARRLAQGSHVPTLHLRGSRQIEAFVEALARGVAGPPG